MNLLVGGERELQKAREDREFHSQLTRLFQPDFIILSNGKNSMHRGFKCQTEVFPTYMLTGGGNLIR